MQRRGSNAEGGSERDRLYVSAIEEHGAALDRLTTGYEADPAKRQDLRQEIHFQLWRSFDLYDGRCNLRTWCFRVAHNTCVSYVNRERRNRSPLVSLDDIEQAAPAEDPAEIIDHDRSLRQLSQLIRTLKPIDRQIMISYLEEIDNTTIADITGLSPANVAMKIHRIKNILSRRSLKESHHV